MKKSYFAIVTLYGKKGSYVAEIDMRNHSRSQGINTYPSLDRPIVVPLSKSVDGFVDLDFPNANYADNGERFGETYNVRDKQRNLLEQFARSSGFQDYLSESINASGKRFPVLKGLPKKIRFESDNGLTFENCRGDGIRTSKGDPRRGKAISKFCG